VRACLPAGRRERRLSFFFLFTRTHTHTHTFLLAGVFKFFVDGIGAGFFNIHVIKEMQLYPNDTLC